MIGVITSSGAGGDCRLQRRCSSPATKADGALRAVSATTTPTLAERSPGGQRGYPWDDESWFGWETTEISPRLEEKTRLWSVLEPKDQKRRVSIMWSAGKVGRPHQQVCRATAEWKSWKRRAKRQLVDERDESAELLLMVDEKQPPRRSSLTLRRCRRFQEPPKICGAMSFLGQIVGRQPMTGIRDLALVGASCPPATKNPAVRCVVLDVLEGQRQSRLSSVNQGQLNQRPGQPTNPYRTRRIHPVAVPTRASFPKPSYRQQNLRYSSHSHTTPPRAWRNLHPPTSVGT